MRINVKDTKMYNKTVLSDIHTLKDYFKKYGNIDLETLIEKVQGDKKYMCPECQGTGLVVDTADVYKDGDKYWKLINNACELCKGEGYTDKEKKPKMVQEGWE